MKALKIISIGKLNFDKAFFFNPFCSHKSVLFPLRSSRVTESRLLLSLEVSIYVGATRRPLALPPLHSATSMEENTNTVGDCSCKHSRSMWGEQVLSSAWKFCLNDSYLPLIQTATQIACPKEDGTKDSSLL